MTQALPTSVYDEDRVGVEIEDGLIDLNLSHGGGLSPSPHGDSEPMLGGIGTDAMSDKAQSSAKEAAANAKFWHLAYYKPYFDVDTETELSRLLKSIWPFGARLYDDSEEADLYGPFWIVSTLAFLMAAMSNLSRFINRDKSDASEWHSDIRKITSSASFLYGALLIVPSVAYGLLRSQSVELSLIKMISLYGYSLVAFLPACVLCVLPLTIAQWLSIAGSLALNGSFLYRNVYRALPEDKLQKPGVHLLIWFTVSQLTTAAVLKFYFFNY